MDMAWACTNGFNQEDGDVRSCPVGGEGGVELRRTERYDREGRETSVWLFIILVMTSSRNMGNSRGTYFLQCFNIALGTCCPIT